MPAMTTEQIKAGLEEERSAWRQRSTYGSPEAKAVAAYKADVMDAALSRLGEPSEDVQPVIAGLELLADEGITLVHCPKCDPENYNNPAGEHCEECPRVLATRALTLLRQQADADLAKRDWREFVARWKAEATSNEVRLLQARVNDLVAQLEALEQRLGVEQRCERLPASVLEACRRVDELIKSQVDLPPEAALLLHENLWNLYESGEPSPAVPAPPSSGIQEAYGDCIDGLRHSDRDSEAGIAGDAGAEKPPARHDHARGAPLTDDCDLWCEAMISEYKKRTQPAPEAPAPRQAQDQSKDGWCPECLRRFRCARPVGHEGPHRDIDRAEAGAGAAELLALKNVTRVEVIGDGGRLFTRWHLVSVQASMQDDGRTLKLFVSESNEGHAALAAPPQPQESE